MTLHRVFVILLFVLLLGAGLRPTVDPDLWWHLRTGEVIWRVGIPRHDVFSFSAYGWRWVAHEWLSEASMWRLYQLAGLPGLGVVFAGLAAVAFWLVFTCSAGRPYLAAAVVVLGALSAAGSLGARPQVINVVFAAVLVRTVERFREGQLSRQALVLLVPFTAVWANLHSGYLLGIALLMLYAIGGALDCYFERQPDGRLAWSDTRLLALLAAVSLGAALLNPYGWRLWSFPVGTLSSSTIQENIQEWGSPNFHLYAYWPFAAMMALGVVAGVAGGKRPSWAHVLLFLTTAGAGLWSKRHIAVFAVVTIPAISRALTNTVAGTGAATRLLGGQGGLPPDRRRSLLHWTLLVVGVAGIGGWNAKKLIGNDAAIAHAYPVAAVDFLEREGLAQARGYNTYQWGGYLIWRHVPVFIDGRAELYGEFLSYYFKTLHLEADWRKPLDDFEVAYVLIEAASPVATLLTASGEWREAYSDDVARVFVRAQPEEHR